MAIGTADRECVQLIIEEAAWEIGVISLKLKQIDTIKYFLDGNDTFVSLAIGYGKSITYALLLSVFDKLLGSYYI